MLAIIIFVLAFLAPIVVALGLVLWRRYIVRDEMAGDVITGVAVGLLAGVLMGGTVTGLLIGLALLIAQARR